MTVPGLKTLGAVHFLCDGLPYVPLGQGYTEGGYPGARVYGTCPGRKPPAAF